MSRFPTAGRAQGFHALVAGMLYRGEDLVLEDDEAVEGAGRKERGEAAEREKAILETAAKKKDSKAAKLLLGKYGSGAQRADTAQRAVDRRRRTFAGATAGAAVSVRKGGSKTVSAIKSAVWRAAYKELQKRAAEKGTEGPREPMKRKGGNLANPAEKFTTPAWKNSGARVKKSETANAAGAGADAEEPKTGAEPPLSREKRQKKAKRSYKQRQKELRAATRNSPEEVLKRQAENDAQLQAKRQRTAAWHAAKRLANQRDAAKAKRKKGGTASASQKRGGGKNSQKEQGVGKSAKKK